MADCFEGVARSVRDALGAVSPDRGAALGALTGRRQGQYGLDVVADELVVAPLRAAGMSVLSEETGWHGPHGGPRVVVAVVDPVDGSTNAAKGLPWSACSLCAVDEHGPWVAVVVDLARGTTYRAVRGAGATRDGERLPLRAAVAVDEAVVGVNGGDGRRPPGWQVRALGCAALELCAVADGGLDGYVNLDVGGHGPWDYLGGVLVAAEAGVPAVDRRGRDLTELGHDVRREVVAAAGAELLEALAMHGADVGTGGSE